MSIIWTLNCQILNLCGNLRKTTFSFLAVNITDINNQLVTLVFCNATFICVFINIKIFLPVVYKFVLVYTILHSSFPILSSYKKLNEEIVSLKDIFKNNEYLHFFINICIKNYLSKFFLPKKVIHFWQKASLFSFAFFRSFISRLETVLKITFLIVH